MLATFSSAQVVEDFLQALLEDAGMADLSPAVKEQMLIDLRLRLNDRFFATLISHLDENGVTEFRKLMEGSDNTNQEKVSQFISSHLNDADQVFGQAMLTFRNDYLGLT